MKPFNPIMPFTFWDCFHLAAYTVMKNKFMPCWNLLPGKHAKKVYIHAFLDGRDTPPRSAKASLENLNAHCKKLNCGKIASIIGRYYAMDRDKRWERVQKAYDLLTGAEAEFVAPDAISALEAAYARGENDEFVKATSIHQPDEAAVIIADGDAIIFMNFQGGSRART